MSNNNNSLFVALLVLAIILFILLLACVGLLIHKRIKSKHKDDDSIACNKQIEKYKELRNKLKQKLAQQANFDSAKAETELKNIIDEELNEYRNDKLVDLQKQIEEKKDRLLKETILDTMQPLHLKIINESSVSYIPIEDRIKPLFIGKKGQNIKRINELTGCNVSVDRTNPYIEISCPNPVDRNLTINIINHLIKSQAFDMTAIDNVYKKEKNLMSKDLYLTGKQYIEKLNIEVADTSIYEYIGRLKYRWSFSQNVLEHCYETALICQGLAQEFNLDPQLAKMCGFFHDIGKSIDYEKLYNHIDSGIKIAKQCNLPQEVINCILKHHRTNCYEDYVLLVRTADAWSAARTGARHMPVSNDEKTISIIEQKCKNIHGITNLKVTKNDNDILISFIPKYKNQKLYLQLKYQIVKAIKKDVRLNKLNVQFVDEII